MLADIIEKNLMKRLDVVVKYFYIKEYYFWKNKKYLNLYKKHIRLMNAGKEDDKESVDVFIQNFDALILSFEKTWFDRSCPLPLSEDSVLLNWAHRLACCMYFNIEPVTEIVAWYCSDYWIDFWWKRLDIVEISEILYCAQSILSHYTNTICTPLFFRWLNNPRTINIESCFKDVRFCGEWSMWLDDNSFQEFVRELYAYDEQKLLVSTIENKLWVLESYKKRFRVVFVQWLSSTLFHIKSPLREIIQDDITYQHPSIDKKYLTFHMAEDSKEHNYIWSVLHHNNISHLLKRLSLPLHMKKYLPIMNEYFLDNWLDRDEICLVWSWPMSLFGLVKMSDIDYIIRDVECQWVIKISSLIDRLDYHYLSKKSNSEVIADKDHHFLFRWWKFLDLSLLLEAKRKWSRKKDSYQVKLLQDFLFSSQSHMWLRKKIVLQYYYMKIRLQVFFLSYAIFFTKKIGIYSFVSQLRRKYFLKRR